MPIFDANMVCLSHETSSCVAEIIYMYYAEIQPCFLYLGPHHVKEIIHLKGIHIIVNIQ